MADTTHVPVIGNVNKKYLYWGIGGVVVIGGIIYWRHQSSAASTANTATTGSAASSFDPNAVDPNSPTGQTYAEESSGDLGSFGYGGVSDYGGSYYGNGDIVGYDQYGNPIYSTGITGNQTYTTNSEWATQAEDDLATMGVDSGTAATAISKILAGLPVTTQQQDLFMQAVGLDGQPPQGYPQPIKLTTTPSQPNPPTTNANTVTVPNVAGQSAGVAHDLIVAAGLVPTAPSAQKPEMKASGTNPKAGTKVKSGSKVTIQTSGWMPGYAPKPPAKK